MRRAAPSLIALVLLVSAAVPAAAETDAPAYDAVIDITFPMTEFDEATFAAGTNYHACRSGCARVHRATDIMGPYGVPVYAAMGGTISFITGEDGDPPAYGYMIRVAGDDGRTYSYIHLGRNDGPPSEAYAPGVAHGVRVERGQHIAFNGHSGNANGNPHLHFEIEDPSVEDPYGSNRMDPYASLAAALDRGDVGPVNGVVPVAGDWDGDGVASPGYFQGGVWTFYESFEATEPYLTLAYGQPGDLPVVGDWDGDGDDTLGVVRGNRWILRNKYVRGDVALDLVYGEVGDDPLVGDWDGDGKDTIGIRRGNLFVLRSVYKRGADDVLMEYGVPSDQPIVGDWDGDGDDTLGVIRGETWILRNVYRRGAQDIIFDMPVSGAHVLAARWDGGPVESPASVRGRTWIVQTGFGESATTASYEVR